MATVERPDTKLSRAVGFGGTPGLRARRLTTGGKAAAQSADWRYRTTPVQLLTAVSTTGGDLRSLAGTTAGQLLVLIDWTAGRSSIRWVILEKSCLVLIDENPEILSATVHA
jgi:hypothetical protein